MVTGAPDLSGGLQAILARLGAPAAAPMAMPLPPTVAQPVAPVETPAQGQIAPVAAPPQIDVPNAADALAKVDNRGPIKRTLSNFLYGFGQAALGHVGLPTDFDKEQATAKLQLAQQAAGDAHQQALAHIQSYQTQADQAKMAAELVQVPDDPAYGVLRNQMLPRGVVNNISGKLATTQLTNTGKLNVAQNNTDSKETIADSKNETAKSIAQANIEAREAIKAGDWKLAAQRIGAMNARTGVSAGNLSLKQLEYRMRAYGTGADGKPLPGIEFDETGRPVGTAMQGNVRPTTTARNAGERAETMQDLATRIKGALNDPEIRKGLGPVMGRLNDIQGRAGTLDGPLSELRNDLVSYGAFQAGLHPVRGIGALQYFDKVMGGLGQDPEELLGKLQSNANTGGSVQKIARRGATPAGGPAPPNAPAKTSHPFFSQFGGAAK